MILVTGDTHGYYDISKLDRREFPYEKDVTKDDYLIICGDFGAIWDNSKDDKWLQNWHKKRPYTTLFVDGNHENFDILNSLPVEQWNGGKVHKINDSVIHLMRGQVFEIDGRKIFTMGGASSHDKERRKLGVSMWEQELPSKEEYEEALKNIEKHNYKVDIVITHCAPSVIEREIMSWLPDKSFKTDKLTDFLQSLLQKLQFKHWYCGHYHTTKNSILEPKLTVLYNKIEVV